MRDAYSAAVSEFMSRAVISLKKDVEIRKAAEVLINRNISGVMVLDDNGAPIGVLSEMDIAAAVKEGRTDAKIEKFMSREVYAVSPKTTLREAAEIMRERNVHRLFVYPGKEGIIPVSGEEVPLGIVTSKDIIRALAGSD